MIQLQDADQDPTGEAAQNTQQMLTYYELDLGLNHVVRKYSEPLEEHGNFLIAGKNMRTCCIGDKYQTLNYTEKGGFLV